MFASATRSAARSTFVKNWFSPEVIPIYAVTVCIDITGEGFFFLF